MKINGGGRITFHNELETVINKQDFIHEKARQNADDPEGARILWSRHAIVELANEHWAREAVEKSLVEAELIEDYPTQHRPLPDCLVLSQLSSDEPLHAVVAVDEANDRLFIVTVYKPNLEEWENDWRTRKS